MDAPHGSFICSRNGIAFEHHGNKSKKNRSAEWRGGFCDMV